MPEKRMWMVRSGEGGYAAEDFRSKSAVGIGWIEAKEDWSKYTAKEAILQKIAATYPENSAAQNQMAASQIHRFVNELAVGDRVITYNPETRLYAVGTIRAAAAYDKVLSDDFPVFRKVQWDGDVERDSLGQDARNSLGAIATLFLVPDFAAAELEALLASGGKASAQEPPAERDAKDILKEHQLKAHESIKDRINALSWEDMQELVAGVLRAMGYKTRVSAPGPDRGKDIVASPDGFGFEAPRIVVEVKHRKGSQMGSNEIRSFLGGRHKDDKGLYVSTGGFTKDARYEAERSQIPLMLMDIDDLARAVTENYAEMDSEARALVPLVRVYWPA